jgi:hypothetical protein
MQRHKPVSFRDTGLFRLKDEHGNYLTTLLDSTEFLPVDANNIYQFWDVAYNDDRIIVSPNNILLMSVINFRMIQKGYGFMPKPDAVEELSKRQNEIGKSYKLNPNGMLISHQKLVDWKTTPYKYDKFEITPIKVFKENVTMDDYLEVFYNTFYTKEEADELRKNKL